MLTDRETLTPRRRGMAFLVDEEGEPPGGFDLYFVANSERAPVGKPVRRVRPTVSY